MNECARTELRDALPDLIHGRLDAVRAVEVETHVASCPTCVAELELLRAVVASAPAAPAMDVGRIVASLPTPTRHGLLLHEGGGQPSVRSVLHGSRTMWSRPIVRIAAAAAIVSAGGLSLLVGRDVLNPETQVGQPRAGVATVDKPTAQVVAPSPVVVASVAPDTGGGQPSGVANAGLSLASETQELSDDHLTTLLSEMELMDGMPSAEPDIIAPAIGDTESAGELK